MKDQRYSVIFIVFALVLTILSTSYLLFGDTAIISEHRDAAFYPTREENLDRYIYAWQDFGSISSYEGLARSWLIVGPFITHNTIQFSRLYFFTLFLISLIIPFVAFRYIILHILKYDPKIAFYISAIISIFYSINPFTIQAFSHPNTYTISYSFLPLLLIVTFKFIDEPRFVNALILACISTLIITPIIRYVVHISVIVTLVTMFYFYFRGLNKKHLLNVLKSVVYLVIILICINAYWLFPTIMTLSSSSLTPGYYITDESVQMFSNSYKVSDMFQLRAAWWPSIEFKSSWPVVFILFVPALVLILSLLYLNKFNNWEKKFVMVSVSLVLFGIFLWNGLKGAFYLLYHVMIFKLPSTFGWMFRVPGYFGSLVTLGIALGMLVPLGRLFSFIFKKARFSSKVQVAKNPVLFTLLVLIILGAGWQRLSGDLDGVFKNGYYLENSGKYEPINFKRFIFVVSDYKGSTKIHHIGKPYVQLANDMDLFVKSLIQKNEVETLSNFLDTIGVDALITDLDFNDDNFQKYKIGDGLIVYVLNQHVSHTSVFDTLAFYSASNDYYYNIFKHDEFAASNIPSTANLIINPKLDESILLESKNKVRLSTLTNHHNPEKVWSIGSTSDPLHGPFHYYLNYLNIETFDIDFGKGIIFTWSDSTIKIPYQVENKGPYYILIRYFENSRGGVMSITKGENEIFRINSRSNKNEFVTKKYGPFSDYGKGVIKIQNMGDFNAVNMIAFISLDEYSGLADEILTKNSIYYIDAHDFRYEPKVISSKILFEGSANEGVHISNLIAPTNSSYTNSLTFTYQPGNGFLVSNLTVTPICAENFADNFELGIHDWFSSGEGLMKLSEENSKPLSGDTSLKVSTEERESNYWSFISSEKVEVIGSEFLKVKSQISASNIKSLHSKLVYYDQDKNEIKTSFIMGATSGTFDRIIDSTQIVPENAKYAEIQFWAKPNMQPNSNFIIDDVQIQSSCVLPITYQDIIFDASSCSTEKNNCIYEFEDLIDSSNQPYNLEFDLKSNSASNIKAKLKTFVAGPELEIFKESLLLDRGDVVSSKFDIMQGQNYVLNISFSRCDNCDIEVWLDDKDVNGEIINLDDTNSFLSDIYLSMGSHKIEVNARSKTIIDSVKLVSNYEKTPLQISYSEEKDSSTLYTINLTSNRPFILEFKENYNPFWVAYVEGENTSNIYKPIPLFNIVNGFIIEDVGDLKIQIKFLPQQWFMMGIIITIMSSVILTIIYAFNNKLHKQNDDRPKYFRF